jgi:ribosomal-protein-alanine N-acetyltransferase
VLGGCLWNERIAGAVRAALERPSITTFVAEQAGRVVGYATAEIEQENGQSDIGIVGYNAVHPDYRGQGIGSALVRRVIRHLKDQGARVLAVWTLKADEAACHIYEKMGFRELARFVYYSMEVSTGPRVD